MDRVFSLQQAMEWFLEHCEGRLLCVDVDPKGNREKECNSYIEAKQFYARVET